MSSTTYPHQSWMASCSATAKLTPFQFCFPGTHDSGAYQNPDFTIVASNEAMAKSIERFAPGYQMVATRWALSQPGQTVYDQLMNGVRYLDFRISNAKDEQGKPTFFLIHTFVVSRLETVLDDIVRFLEGHPSELLVIDIGLYYQIVPQDLQAFMYSKLKKYMYPDTKEGKITETVEAITKQGKQIIACWGSSGSSRTSTAFFTRDEVLYVFPFLSVDNVTAKQAYLLKNLATYMELKDKKLFQLTYTLTEVAIDVAASIFAGGSLKKFADKMNPSLPAFITALNPLQRAAIGMIECDDQVNSQNVPIAKMLLAERIAHMEPVARPLAAIGLPGERLPVKPGAPSLAVATRTDHNAWIQGESGKALSQQQRQKKRTSCWRYVCCCVCCQGQSDDDEELLV